MAIFASRRVNVDPFPYVGEHGSRHAYPGTLNQKRLEFDPRPEFDNVVNPVLEAFRSALGTRSDLAYLPSELAREYLETDTVRFYPEEFRDHARRVLQKLAAFRK